jgi:hypothetical protein
MPTKEYKAVKQYIHNSIQITKSYIEDIVIKTVSDIVDKKFDRLIETNWFSNLVIKTITKNSSRWDYGMSFENYLQRIVASEVQKMIRENYKVKVNVESINKAPSSIAETTILGGK